METYMFSQDLKRNEINSLLFLYKNQNYDHLQRDILSFQKYYWVFRHLVDHIDILSLYPLAMTRKKSL